MNLFTYDPIFSVRSLKRRGYGVIGLWDDEVVGSYGSGYMIFKYKVSRSQSY